jgi:Fe2+ or Zn2+ uptake regulation protein
MNNGNPNSIQNKDYQDFITFTPQSLKYLTIEQQKLSDAHLLIISNLRNQEMTAKEIHNLYFDKKRKKHSKTIKTIYRYLEKLEDAGIVAVAGHRITKGSRVAEKLYARTAKVFIRESSEEMCKERLDEYAQILTKFISILFKVENPSINSFKEVFSQFFTHLSKETTELLDSIATDEEIAEYFAKTEIGSANYILDLSATFGTLIRHPDLLEQIRILVE